MSFEEFREFQEEYCGKVADHLNVPIDWHVVLDASASYIRRDRADRELTAALQSILRGLPLWPGDTVAIEAFNDRVHRASRHIPVTSDPLEVLEAESLPVIETLAADLQRGTDRTDLIGLFEEGSLEPHPEPRPDAHTYYVVLTDGQHDPLGNQRPQPMFQVGGAQPPQAPQARSYLDILSAFVVEPPNNLEGRFRRLVLLIDHQPTDRRRVQDAIRTDWNRAINCLLSPSARCGPQFNSSTLRSKLESGLLRVARWTSGRFFTEEMKREIARRPGIYACLVAKGCDGQAALRSRTCPTATGLGYPPPEKPEELPPYRVRLPAPLMNADGLSANLPLVLLTSAKRKRDFLMELRRVDEETRRSTLLDGPRYESCEVAGDDLDRAWRPLTTELRIPSLEGKPEAGSHPWTLQLKFRDQRDREPFFMAQLLGPGPMDVLWGMLQGTHARGRLLAVVSLLLWGFSLVPAWLYAQSIQVGVRDPQLKEKKSPRSESQEESPEDPDFKKDTYIRKAYRCIINGVGVKPAVKVVFRQDGPPKLKTLKDSTAIVDTVVVAGVVYYIWYHMAVDNPEQPGSSERIVFEEGKQGLVGDVYAPRGFWKPRSGAGPFKRSSYEWTDELEGFEKNCAVAAIVSEPDLSEEKADPNSDRQGATGRSCDPFRKRLQAMVLTALAMGFAGAALVQAVWRSAGIVPLVGLGVVFLVLSVVFNLSRFWSNGKSFFLRWDACGAFTTLAAIAGSILLAFVAEDGGDRIVISVGVLLAWFLSLSFYDKLRDWFVRGRIAKRKPIAIGDTLLEIAVARLWS